MSNGTDVVLSQDFRENLKKRISEMVFSAISDAQVDQMIQKEIDDFFKVEVKYNVIEGGYNTSAKLIIEATPFRRMVWSALSDRIGGSIKEFMDKQEYKATQEFLDSILGMPLQNVATTIAMTYQKTMEHEIRVESLLKTAAIVKTAVNSITNNPSLRQYASDQVDAVVQNGGYSAGGYSHSSHALG